MKKNLSHRNNVLLTGIPRSGTTLCCALLNRLPNTVALVEPFDVSVFNEHDRGANWISTLSALMSSTRTGILDEGTAPTRTRVDIEDAATTDAFRLTNTIATTPSANTGRRVITAVKLAAVRKPLKPNFTLIVKHPNAFAAMLPELSAKFRCYAVVRNPVEILSSWSSLDLPLRDGHAPAAEACSPELRRQLAAVNDPVERQITLLNWYFRQFRQYLEPGQVIRYEAMVKQPAFALARISNAASVFHWMIGSEISKPVRSSTTSAALRFYGERLLQHGGDFQNFYSEQQLIRATSIG